MRGRGGIGAEPGRLQDELLRAGVRPFGWVVNQSFAGHGGQDPVLRERGAREKPFIEEVRGQQAARFALIPWMEEAPVGPERLLALLQGGAAESLAEVHGTEA